MMMKLFRTVRLVACLVALVLWAQVARGEAMLQLFNVNWDELIQKMPEIAEAGYTSLWLPPPARAGSVFSVGYDLFDPFDLGDKNQRGTTRTKYGTKEQLLQVVETAHRFGLRVYFDNVMNHRGFDIPGYNSSTPANLYPGLCPQDFHLQTISGGYYRNWPNVANWNNVTEVQTQPLYGLIDLATEPGSLNINFGPSLGSVIVKPSYIRQPANPEYYMAPNLPSIGGPWRPFSGSNGVPVAEDVNAYLIRAAMWMLYETKCDGFRFDAVKHVPAMFYGDTFDSANGYSGAVQAMYDYVHGYGNNVVTNGYFESGGNRDSNFDTEAPRNDALLFGEHMGEPPGFQDYLDRGMRLLNSPYHFQLNNILGNPGASLAGLDQRDYRPYSSAFTGPQSVLFAQSHDDGVAIRRELQHAYNFMREGLPSIYSDGYNESTANPGEQPFPRVASAPYLGQFNDNKMPDIAWLHHQLARGGTRSRWSDSDIVAFERYDYRDVDLGTAYSNPDATVVLFAMNDNYASDISFDDGFGQATEGTFYECFPVDVSRGQGLVVGFPAGSVLYQLGDSPNKGSACAKLLVRFATQSQAEAQATKDDPNPVNRKVYVGGQLLAPGGGAIEFKIPKGSYVMYAYQWPEPSRVGFNGAITFRQNGVEAPKMTVYRHDGYNGDAGFNPLYPFKMRGSVDSSGNVVRGVNVSNRTYAIQVPLLTNAPFDLVVRADASASNVLIKMDGGMDLNSHLGFAPVAGVDRRDYRPGYASDIYLGYERTAMQFRYGPEKFAAMNVARDNVTSTGAETYRFTLGGTNMTVDGAGNGADIVDSTASWVYHAPSNEVTVAGTAATQRNPLNPPSGQDADIWVKVGHPDEINRAHIYYTTDGSDPEGSFGTGQGTTRVAPASFAGNDLADPGIHWWKGTIPGSNLLNDVEVRYKVALFHNAVNPMTDADRAKLYGLSQATITNFNPSTTTVWLHNDLNPSLTTTGLQEGFHIVRARVFLPRAGKSSVFGTCLQTFYYDAQPPGGALATPAVDGAILSNTTYTVVVRADSSVTGVECNVVDSDPANDDVVTGKNNGNGLTNGVPKFVSAASATPNAALNALYPNYPQEFRFSYVGVPSSGSATITVRLKEFATSIIPSRMTTLTRTVSTVAPSQVLYIANPAANGQVLTLGTNDVYTIQTCLTSTLTTNTYGLFSIYINGVFQPRNAVNGTPLYNISPFGCGQGLRSLSYNWQNPQPGSNVIQVIFTNQVYLNDARAVAVVRPGDSDNDGMTDFAELLAGTDPFDPGSVLRITSLASGSQLVVWDSVPAINYQLLATTNLNEPMAPVSPIIPASGASTFYYDTLPGAASKFYRVKVAP